MADPSHGADRRAAVLGRPIAHSLSPVLHRAAYAALGLDWSYEAIDCGAEELAAVLAGAGLGGFSCTMPLKRAVLEVADEVRAARGGGRRRQHAAPRPGGGWIADNTDVVGLAETVREAGLAPASVTVLGAGGTAQALVAALPSWVSTAAPCSCAMRPDRRAA